MLPFTATSIGRVDCIARPTSTGAVGGFVLAAALLAVFVRWELRTAAPMLPVTIFRNLRFSAASVAITSAFFALFGFIGLLRMPMQLTPEVNVPTITIETRLKRITWPWIRPMQRW